MSSRNPRKLPRTHTVAFETWTQKTTDVLRLKRLLLGAGVGLGLVLGGVAFVVVTSSRAAAEIEEEEAKVIEVQLAKEPEPEPEPPPPPPPPELKPLHSNPGPKLQKIETPVTISTEKVQEKEVKPSSGGGEDPYQKGSGDGTTGEKAVVEAPVTPPPPPPPPVIRKDAPRPVSETDTPPELLNEAIVPQMPAEAVAAGIEGTVIVKWVVTETGAVSDVRVLKGPPELHAVCIAAVKAMRFKPGRDADGVARAFTKIKKFKFKLRT